MKKIIIIIIFLAATIVMAVSDPNALIVPPPPGTETISVVDDETLRITYSVDIKKIVLTRRKERKLLEIEQLKAEIAVINAKLAEFK